jgi:aspartate/methionine/tyrosine aminotransferase
MSPYNPIAEALNKDLQENAPQIFDLLSARGKSIYFPSKGILGQTAEAKGAKINATIGKNPGLKGKKFSLPVVTAALTHALSVCGYLFVDEGDTFILPDLYWDNYELIFSEAYGAKFSLYNTFVKGGYDVDAFSRALRSGGAGKKIVLLNFPNNPTGYTVTESEAKALAGAILEAAEEGNRIVVLLDDAYFGLVYEEGITRESLFTLLVDLHPNVLGVKLDGPTKEDYVWVFRVGFMTFGFRGAGDAALKALEHKAAGVVRGNISNVPNLSQSILLKAYTAAEYAAQKKQKYEILSGRARRIRAVLKAHPEYAQSFEVMPFNSGYFMCVKPIGVAAEAVRKELLAHFDTGVIVLSGLIRLAFSSVPTDRIEAMFDNLHAAVQNLRR